MANDKMSRKRAKGIRDRIAAHEMDLAALDGLEAAIVGVTLEERNERAKGKP
jgi:hypothetical protein